MLATPSEDLKPESFAGGQEALIEFATIAELPSTNYKPRHTAVTNSVTMIVAWLAITKNLQLPQHIHRYLSTQTSYKAFRRCPINKFKTSIIQRHLNQWLKTSFQLKWPS